MRQRMAALWAATGILALAAGCAGPSASYKAQINTKLDAHDWTGAAALVDENKDKEYGKKNEVLYLLDKAEIFHDAGLYKESDQLLDRAEQRLEELYTQSITKAAGTFVLNDNTDDYRGEPHERALLYVIRALNYVYMNRADDAVVEARKASAFLQELNDKYGNKSVYRNDAFVQYISGLLFEQTDKPDDARISFQTAHEVYLTYAGAYKTPEPVFNEPATSANEGELVLLHFNGPGPRRESRTIQVAWNQAVAIAHESGEKDSDKVKNAAVAGLANDAITVAFPNQVQDPFVIKGSEVEVDGVKTPTLLVEDISAISAKALEDKINAIRAKAIARAAIKFAIAKATEAGVSQAAGKGWGKLAGLLARVTAAATESADTRCWGTLPAEIRMARLRLPAGKHEIKIEYLDAKGAPVSSEVLSVQIEAGKRSWAHVRTVS